MKNRRRAFFGLLGIVMVTTLVVAACRTSSGASNPPSPTALPEDIPAEFSIIFETYRYLKQDFVDQEKLDPKALSEAAVRGMLESLNEPHTSYLSPELFDAEQEQLRGSFEGIGAFVGIQSGRITIVSPIAGSPAEAAGIRAGDVILEVNGEKTDTMTLNEAVAKIRGPKGTTVRLLVQHQDSPEPVVLEVVRDEIKVASVHTQELPDNLLRVQITTFAENTARELVSALRQARRDKAEGIVLDLRNNPGGLLSVTVDVASQFLSGGLVLYEIDGQGVRKDWPVQGDGLARDIPVVVLVNSGSASGSEVLAGALQDHGKAKLIGTQTFGKGSVNHVRQLSNGGGLFITSSRWHTPNGRLIEQVGLTPDIEVPITREDVEAGRDPQLDKALELLRQQVLTAAPAS